MRISPSIVRPSARLAAALALSLAAAVSWALPSPKDIEQSVNAGEYRQAETQLREVLKEKPTSARAHYELGQVLAREGKNAEARQALLEAQRLDPSPKFAKSPQRFRELLDQIPLKDAAAAAPVTRAQDPLSSSAVAPAPAPQATPAAPAPSGGFPWSYVFIGAGVLFIVWQVAKRVLTPPAPAYGVNGAPLGGASYGAPSYGGYGQPAPSSAGSHLGSAVLGGIAGAAAGYGLAKVLERDEPTGGAGSGATGHSASSGGGGFTPIDNPPDYGAFDAGSGASDSWDDGGSSSSSDDW